MCAQRQFLQIRLHSVQCTLVQIKLHDNVDDGREEDGEGEDQDKDGDACKTFSGQKPKGKSLLNLFRFSRKLFKAKKGIACNSATKAHKLLAVACKKMRVANHCHHRHHRHCHHCRQGITMYCSHCFQGITLTISVLSDSAGDESSGRNGAANEGAQDRAHLNVWEDEGHLFAIEYQKDSESHKAGQDTVLNFQHHTKLAKLHSSSPKTFN